MTILRTTFSQDRWAFTKRAHLAARRQLYPAMFPGGVDYEDTTKTVRDLDYAIDCQLAIPAPGLRATLRLSVQERYRNPADMHWGDVTITEWNLPSGEPSELHKLAAHLFVYGFYDADGDRILYATVLDVPRLLLKLVNGELPYARRPRGDQTFLAIRWRDLEAAGAVILAYDDREGKRCVTYWR